MLTKAADERGWSPEQLQHMGQLYNTAKSVTFMDKVAQEKRGSQHAILDVPKMVSDFARLPVKAAAPSQSGLHSWFEDGAPVEKSAAAAPAGLQDSDWFEDESVKEASHVLPNFMSDMQPDLLEKSASAKTPEYRTSAATYHTQAMEELREKQSRDLELQHLSDFTWEQVERLNGQLTKFAKSSLFSVADEVEQDMQVVLGTEKSARVFQALESFCKSAGHTLKRASAPAEGVVFDRHGAKDQFLDIWDAASLIDTAQQMKSAATAEDEKKETSTEGRMIPKAEGQAEDTHQSSKAKGKDPTSAKTETEKSDKAEGKDPTTATTTPSKGEESAPEKKPAAPTEVPGKVMQTAEQGLGGIQALVSAPATALGEHGARMQGVVDAVKPAENEHQRAVDEGTAEAQSQATLQRLLLTDDVIKGADPDTVQRLYTALVTEEPALAVNPEALAIALREAIQYNGVPTHTMTELGKHRKTRLDSEKLESEADRRTYAN